MIKKNLLLVLLSLILSLILIELSLIFFYPQNLTGSFRTYGKSGLLLNKKDVVVPAFHLGKKVTNYTFGKFHNRKYNLKSVDNKILVLGDSFTFGWLLNDKDTFVYKLDKDFDNFTLVNAAAGGWGTSDQLRYLMDFCDKIKPKYVIIFLNTYDLGRSIASGLFEFKNGSFVEGSNKTSRLKTILEKSKIYNFSIENIHLVSLLKKIYLKKNKSAMTTGDPSESFLDPKKKDEHQIFYKQLLLKLKEETKICKSKMIIVNIAWSDYSTPITKTDMFLKYNIDFFNDRFNFIDLNSDMFKIYNNKNEYIIKDDGHPNSKANKYLHKIIYKKLSLLIN